MYYSIPGNRDKKLPGKDVDVSELNLLSSGTFSRSFTIEAPMKNPNLKSPRRNSHTGSETAFDLALKCLSIEEEKKNGGDSIQSQHQSSNDVNRSSPDRTSNRNSSTSSEIQTKLVERKSVISYESYVDKVLEDVIDEATALQPGATRGAFTGSTDRRGSLLEDIPFRSIAELNGLADFEYDTEY